MCSILRVLVAETKVRHCCDEVCSTFFDTEVFRDLKFQEIVWQFFRAPHLVHFSPSGVRSVALPPPYIARCMQYIYMFIRCLSVCAAVFGCHCCRWPVVQAVTSPFQCVMLLLV